MNSLYSNILSIQLEISLGAEHGQFILEHIEHGQLEIPLVAEHVYWAWTVEYKLLMFSYKGISNSMLNTLLSKDEKRLPLYPYISGRRVEAVTLYPCLCTLTISGVLHMRMLIRTHYIGKCMIFVHLTIIFCDANSSELRRSCETSRAPLESPKPALCAKSVVFHCFYPTKKVMVQNVLIVEFFR